MWILLRQLVALFVVTIVAAGLAISMTTAAMALDCEIAALRAVPDSAIDGVFAADSDRFDQPALTDTSAHAHQEHDSDGGSLDAGASHCEAHACPSSAIPAFHALMPSADVGQSLTVIRAGSLVELTVPEGLRRPPRG